MLDLNGREPKQRPTNTGAILAAMFVALTVAVCSASVGGVFGLIPAAAAYFFVYGTYKVFQKDG